MKDRPKLTFTGDSDDTGSLRTEDVRKDYALSMQDVPNAGVKASINIDRLLREDSAVEGKSIRWAQAMLDRDLEKRCEEFRAGHPGMTKGAMVRIALILLCESEG